MEMDRHISRIESKRAGLLSEYKVAKLEATQAQKLEEEQRERDIEQAEDAATLDANREDAVKQATMMGAPPEWLEAIGAASDPEEMLGGWMDQRKADAKAESGAEAAYRQKRQEQEEEGRRLEIVRKEQIIAEAEKPKAPPDMTEKLIAPIVKSYQTAKDSVDLTSFTVEQLKATARSGRPGPAEIARAELETRAEKEFNAGEDTDERYEEIMSKYGLTDA